MLYDNVGPDSSYQICQVVLFQLPLEQQQLPLDEEEKKS